MSTPHGECPICKIKFLDGDDIVTCPSCGAPYHRECYMKKGHCIYEDKHASGFEYNAPASQKTAGAAYQNGTQGQNDSTAGAASHGGMLCSNCRTINDSRNIFCEKCGNPLHGNAQGNVPPPSGGAASGGPGMGVPPNRPTPAMMNGMYVDMSGEIDGISKNDWAQYIGKSSPVYLYRMSNMQKNNSKISFMASPFIFGPFYFAYRKAWGWAGITLLARILLLIPQLLQALFLGDVAMPAFFTADNLQNAVYIASYVSLALRMVLGLFGLQMFRKSAGKRMKALKQRHESPQEYYKALIHNGGTSVSGVLICMGIIFVLYTIFYVMFKDALVAYTLLQFPGLKDFIGL